jgi:hypothetical protein
VSLSADQPADQRAYTLAKGPADADVVAALARALHAEAPVRSGEGWRAGLLTVSGTAGQAWTWSSCGGGPDVAVSSDGSTSSGCAVSSAPGSVSGGASGSGGTAVAPPVPGIQASPAPQPSLPPDVPDALVRDAARDVLHAVGLDVADATIDTSSYGGSATVDRPGTVGMSTRVDVDRTGTITSASGWLGTAKPADLYPVVSAKDAFASLPRLMHPDICRVAPDGQGCLPPEPVVITGAALGLSLQPTADGGSTLVPSWLFAVKDGGTMAAIAVQPQYLSSDPKTGATDLPATAEPSSDPGKPVPLPPVPASTATETKPEIKPEPATS